MIKELRKVFNLSLCDVRTLYDYEVDFYAEHFKLNPKEFKIILRKELGEEGKRLEKKRGRPKGQKNKPGHKAGRPTVEVRKERQRNKTFSVKVTTEELEKINKFFKEKEGKKIEIFLKMCGLEYKKSL